MGAGLQDQDRFVGAFIAHCLESWTADTFVRLVLSAPRPGAARGARPGGGAWPQRITARLVYLDGEPQLSLTEHEPARDVTRNETCEAAAEWLRAVVGTVYGNALLGTTLRDWQLHVPAAGGARLVGHRPAVTATPARGHDRERVDLLGPAARDWLQALGLVDGAGRVFPSRADKYRQVRRSVELLAHLGAEAGWGRTAGGGAAEEEAGLLTVADMGCGKGYLTFGLWHLLCRAWGRRVRVIGVEGRPELAAGAAAAARAIGAEGLEFVEGAIATVDLPPLDGLVALHACNTATDDAILRGIALGAGVIAVAPCCHKEVRPQLAVQAPLAAVIRHGIMRERLAEWATDGLRALFLEWAGYDTKVLEFVPSEHTPKNLLIAGVRRAPAFTDVAARGRVLAFKQAFGVERHALDPLLDRG